MKIIDLVYFLSYRAYSRKNDSKFGVFSILAIWMAIFQMIVIYNFWLIIGLATNVYSTESIERNIHITLFFFLIVVNHIYVYAGNRKATIMSRFDYLGEKKEKRYWYILVVFFIAMWGVLITLSIINKNLQGI